MGWGAIIAELSIALAALIVAVAFAADRMSLIRSRRPWASPKQLGTWTIVEPEAYDDPEGVIDL